jgi:monomeric sarcosine oxidase
MSDGRADVIVIGGGTMGTAAGWALARQGHSVIVLEQFQHIHTMGSHGGHTRIFRHAYFEGPAYVPWTIESDNAWSALQVRTGIDLMIRCGCLDMSAPGLSHARNAGHSAALYNLPHEMLTGDEVNERFPVWSIPSDWEACLDPDAGILLIEPTLRALITEFREAGGTLVENVKVQGWQETAHGVTVSTSNGAYEADRIIVTAGAWAGKLLADINLPLEVRRKPVMWFDVAGQPGFGTDKFPAFIADTGPDNFYGLPAHGDDGIKIGDHRDRNIVDPDNFNRDVSLEDLKANLRDFITMYLKGVRPELAATDMCMYTMTPDEDFIIDRHPSQERVSFAAGFSGHGYKFAPVVGELLADLATRDDASTPEHFALNRFAAV